MEFPLDALPDASHGVLDALPIDVIANLMKQAEAHLADATRMNAILHGVLARRYANGLNDTGTHHRSDGEFDIKITVPKNVAWDQKRLADAMATIRDEWQSNPADYVDAKLSVSETKYTSWPAEIREMFTPARTVKPGKPKFEIARRDADEREAA